jgi:hypothetical protein
MGFEICVKSRCLWSNLSSRSLAVKQAELRLAMHRRHRYLIPAVAMIAFFGPDDPAGGGGTAVVTPPPNPNPNPAPSPRTFTQADLDRIVNTEKQKWQNSSAKTVAELEQLKQNVNLTEQEKQNLQVQIDQLKETYTTEQEQLKSTHEKLKQKYDADTQRLTEESKTWKSRFQTEVKRVAILNAAQKFEAYNPDQIMAILDPITTVEEGVGEDSRPNGQFESKVDFTGVDKDGKSVKLKLSPENAVKMMTEMVDRYGNLFKTTAQSGFGGNNNGSGQNRLGNLEGMDLEEYKKNRDKVKERMS